MKVVFLGTASSKPSPDRNVSGIAIQYKSEIILFDCGEGTQRQMLRMIKQSRISKIFISHFHGDHYLGLPGLLMTMSLNGRKDPIHIYGPTGTIEFIKNLLNSGYMEINFEIMINELNDSEIEGNGYRIISFPVDHGVPSLGFVFVEDDKRGKFDRKKAEKLGISGKLFSTIEKKGYVDIEGKRILLEDVTGDAKKGKKITYSGDTRPIKFPVETKGSNLLIHEATFLTDLERGDTYHSTIKEACKAAIDIQAKKLVLTHLNSRYSKEEIWNEANIHFNDVVVAEDMLVIEI